MIRLRFTKDPTLTGLIVRAYTWCAYDHVEIVCSSGYLGARPDGGVKIRPWDYIRPLKEAFATVDYNEVESDRFLAAAIGQLDKPYDWSAIYGIALHRDWRDLADWICSELIGWCGEETGRPMLNTWAPVNRLSPRDIMLSPLLKFDNQTT